ncbi:MAG: hypothetical protein HY820_45010 [Acidobacteria bacterium]|nr:hypothetical protein [Acidobacteriota bacterium]
MAAPNGTVSPKESPEKAPSLGNALEAEFQYLFRQMSAIAWIGHLMAIAVFGVGVPLRQGLDFLDVMFLLAYSCLPCLFASPLVADSVVSRKPAPARVGYLAQVLTPFLFAVFWNAVILVSALATVNASNWLGRVILPPRPILWNSVVFSVAATYFASSVTAWLSLNAKTAAAAKSQARRLFLLLLVVVLMYTRFSPPQFRRGLEDLLTADRITSLLVPVSVVLAGIAYGVMLMGARRREEEASGPIFKLL